jgi:hypothetical protein
MKQTFTHPTQQSKRPNTKEPSESKLKRLFQLFNSSIRKGKPSRFKYLLDKLQEARIHLDPFEHIYIEDFLSADDFSEIIACHQISIGKSVSHEHLLLSLIDCGYGAQKFPGCTPSLIEYIRFLNGEIKSANIDTCETMGMALRLQNIHTPILEDLLSFLSSDKFVQLLVNKFSINEKCHHDYGIQKYLTGYEISPHPDIKRK